MWGNVASDGHPAVLSPVALRIRVYVGHSGKFRNHALPLVRMRFTCFTVTAGGDPINPSYDKVGPRKVPSALAEQLLWRTFRPTESQHDHPSQETSRRLVTALLTVPGIRNRSPKIIFGLGADRSRSQRLFW